MKYISLEDLQQIFYCANDKLRHKLRLWTNPFGVTVIDDEKEKEIFKNCTPDMIDLVKRIFGIKDPDLSEIKEDKEYFKENGCIADSMIAIRNTGKMKNKAFYLNDMYTWELKRDSNNHLLLVPTKKL